jgi:hypothetical protein
MKAAVDIWGAHPTEGSGGGLTLLLFDQRALICFAGPPIRFF